MKYTKFIAFILIGISLSACVSKKKYNQLQSSKQRSDAKVRELSKENNSLSSDLKAKTKESNNLQDQLNKLKQEYNDMKNDMLESNARKTSAIEEMNKKLSNLSSDKASLKDSLQSAINRMNKREQSLSEKQRELNAKLGQINKLEIALEAYNKQLNELETLIKESFIKYDIIGCYLSKANGKIVVTFDDNVLMDSKDSKLGTNGKKGLKVLAAILEKRPSVSLTVGSNWDSDTDAIKAWEITQDRANLIIEYISLNGDVNIQRLGQTSTKIIEQPVAGGKGVSTAVVLQPTLQSIMTTFN